MGDPAQIGETGEILAASEAETKIKAVSIPGQAPPTEYVTICEPTPAVVGLNVPLLLFTIPGPDQLPPEVPENVKICVPAVMQNCAGLTFTTAPEVTVIKAVSLEAQEPVVSYMIRCVPTPAIAGLKVPNVVLVIPGPDQVPPCVPVTVRFVAY